MKILLTGCAGFIGSHVLDRLLHDGHQVIGVDNFDPYYPRHLKERNLEISRRHKNFTLIEADLLSLSTYESISKVIGSGQVDAILHFAAKGGVRPSIADPIGYQKANVIVTQNVLEFARQRGIQKFIFASSSSVYGKNPNVPWHEADNVLLPISPYASSKVSCELMGHVYSQLFDIQFIALRFFTVYGARQRPDLAINLFVQKIRKGEVISLFGDGTTRRDYTHVSDIVAGVIGALMYRETQYEVINLGNSTTVTLLEMIGAIEKAVGKKALINWIPEQAGDVPQTWASIEKARKLLGYHPKVGFLENGLEV